MLQQKRLILLMYRVNDQRRLGEMAEIFNDVDEPTIRTMIEESNGRESHIKEQKRKGEVMINNYFKFKLESSILWERW